MPNIAQVTLSDADATRAFGERLASILKPGDLVVLSGDLGAGKTTLTQGIGRGLGVRGQVASPTFTIARVHPSLGDGPALIHVDAYRLRSLDEVDGLDLEASMEDSVTVVEWGEGWVEGLSPDRLDVKISRPHGDEAGSVTSPGPSVPGEAQSQDPDADPLDISRGERGITVTGHGPRWEGVTLH